MTIKELTNKVKEYMIIEDPLVVKFIIGAFITNQIPSTSPLWVFLVGPSSGGKSQLLKSLSRLPQIHMVDDLTPNTLISGFKGKKGNVGSSLLSEMGRGDILVMKDFTVVLEKAQDSRDAIIGQLRMVADGEFTKRFGNESKEENEEASGIWNGKIGAIFGCTEAVHMDRDKFAKMGERFVMYNFAQPDDRREEATEWVLSNRIKLFNIDDVFRDSFTDYIKSVQKIIPKTKIAQLESAFTKEISALAEFISRARSAVERDKYSRDKVIQGILSAEMPFRVGKEFFDQAMGLVMLNIHDGLGEILLDEDKKIVYKTAMDTLPKDRLGVIEVLTKYNEATTENVGKELHLPAETVKRTLENLMAHKVIHVHRGIANRQVWQLHEKYRAIMTKFKNIQATGESLLEDEDDKIFPTLPKVETVVKLPDLPIIEYPVVELPY